MCGVHALVCVALLITTAAYGAPDPPSTWIRSQPTQSLYELLGSIDSRLQTLEHVKWDPPMKQLEQRLDSLEVVIRRLDSSFQDRLDKLERNLNSKEIKDELMVEKLSHKVRDMLDTSYDRYNRRLGYTEERLEISIKKMQMSVEGSLNRIEKQQEDIQTEVLEGVTLLDDIKSHSFNSEDRLNSTHKAIQEHIQRLISPNQEELQRISGSLEHLGSRLNSSQGLWGGGSQNDGPLISDVATTVRKEINIEAMKFSHKMTNMYNNLWSRIMSVETLVKELTRVANSTQQVVLAEMRSVTKPDRRDFPRDSQENYLEVALDALEHKLQRKLVDLGHKLEDRLDTLTATQNLVMDSCFDGSICDSLETQLSKVLEKMFHIISDKIEGFSNRTVDTDGLVVEMMELVKTQHSALIRTMTHNTNMVVTLTQDYSRGSKLLHTDLSQMADTANHTFQKLHRYMQALSNTSGICADGKDNDRYTTEQQTPLLTGIPQNITEVNIVPLNTTEAPNESTDKSYDAGILKITTDDLQLTEMFSNTSVTEPLSQDTNKTKVFDPSVVAMFSTILPNMTRDQLESVLLILNKSISFENLEAIIQNTEAQPDDENLDVASEEIYDVEIQNKTFNDEDINIVQSFNKFLPFNDNSVEIEDVSEEVVEEDLNDIEEPEVKQNISKILEPETSLNIINETQEVSPELKEQLKIYTLLMKIKIGEFDNSELWNQLQNTTNTKHNATENLTHLLPKLCYGAENRETTTLEELTNIMRNRLLLINQQTTDKQFYENVENLCNTMNEFHQNQKITKGGVSTDSLQKL